MSKTRPWQWVALGCGGLVLLMLATAAFFSVLYWPKLTAVYQQAKAGATEIMHVSQTLQNQYGGQVAVTVSRQSRVAGTTLHITLTNPTFFGKDDPGEEALQEKAREIAATAHRMGVMVRFDHYEIEFVRQSGTAATTSRSWSYSFNASDLPPAKDKS